MAGMDAYRKAWEAYQSGRHQEAKQWTQQALQADRENPHAHALLGDLHYLAHDLEAAEEAWEQALKVDPRLRALQERLIQLAQERQLEQGQAAVSSELFVIRIPDLAELDPTWVLKELEKGQRFLEKQLQFQLQGPITVLIYRPKVFYEDLHVPTVVAGLFDGKIRMSTVAGSSGIALEAVLWHELAHVAVQQLTRSSAPRWLHEGVAQLAQAQIAPIFTGDLKVVALRDETPRFHRFQNRYGGIQLGQGIPMNRHLFYQASWAYAQYILEHRGWSGIRRLLKEIGQGTDPAEALAKVVGMKQEVWEQRWRRWVKEHL